MSEEITKKFKWIEFVPGTSYAEVPGGWLFKVVEESSVTANLAVAITFVPEPKQ